MNAFLATKLVVSAGRKRVASYAQAAASGRLNMRLTSLDALASRSEDTTMLPQPLALVSCSDRYAAGAVNPPYAPRRPCRRIHQPTSARGGKSRRAHHHAGMTKP